MPSALENADHWLDQSRAPGLGDHPFMRFMTAWIGLNALYAEESQTVDGDRNQVRAFARDDRLLRAHCDLMRDELLPDYARSVDVLAARGVRNLRNNRVCKLGGDRPLVDVLDCIYQVRCNCFHGGKHQADRRDRDLVTASFVIVINLLGMHL